MAKRQYITEAAVRQKVEKLLKRPVSDVAWKWAIEAEYVSAVMEADEFGEDTTEPLETLRERLVHFESHLLQSGRKPGGRNADEVVSAAYDPSALDRAAQEAICSYVETQSARRPDVCAFREALRKCLPETAVNAELDARDLLRGEIPTLLTFEQLAQLGLAITDQVNVMADHNHPLTFRYTIHPTYVFRKRDKKTGYSKFERVTQHFTPITVEFQPWECISIQARRGPGFFGVSEHPFAVAFRSHNREHDFNLAVLDQEFRFPTSNWIFSFTPTITGQAIRLATEIAEDYSVEVFDALTLLVTGKLPRTAIVAGQYSSRKVYDDTTREVEYLAHGPITLRVEPWIPVAIVAKIYRAMQTEVFGGDNHPLTVENAQFFSVILRHFNPERKRYRWSKAGEEAAQSGIKAWAANHIPTIFQRVRNKLFPFNYWATAARYFHTKRCSQEDAKREEAEKKKKKAAEDNSPAALANDSSQPARKQ